MKHFCQKCGRRKEQKRFMLCEDCRIIEYEAQKRSVKIEKIINERKQNEQAQKAQEG